ncbi:hypothetical protein [[Flexibacter] sp. ATCC 35208]|uniref:hypothetical protein n=1 Tax=[Flexibacter] sp. ATCC 35208 TaxID=1936242 RepID=UPI0009CE052F|nr:hypothetical protein [[Flexibacter] sp. ATCC 35208]OMP80023.1 hypothetical protein BW716_05890 [[Flexibacter] sp. ATCC 35208]
MLRRQCTSEYKIAVVDKVIRSLYGLRPYQRRPLTSIWKGITTDEIDRMSQPTSSWKIHTYPFTGYAWSKNSYERLKCFNDTAQVNYAIRDSTNKGIKKQCYIHRSLQPLEQVVFNKQDELWENECSGNCHTL